jgi:hypothetical protein
MTSDSWPMRLYQLERDSRERVRRSGSPSITAPVLPINGARQSGMVPSCGPTVNASVVPNVPVI